MKHRVRNSYFIAQILLICMMLMPPLAFAPRTATLSVNPASGVITYPTYTINVIMSPVTSLWQVRFTLSYNDGIDDFLEVPTGGVELGDLFAGKAPLLSTGEYYLADSGISYLEVLIEMPGTETVTSLESKSIAKITFKLLDNAMPGMTSQLKLEWADATFYIGTGDPPYEYIDSKIGGISYGISFPQQGTVTVGYLVTTLTINAATAIVEMPVVLSSTIKDGGGNPLAGLSVDYYVDSVNIGSALTDDYGVSSISYTPLDVGTPLIKAEYAGGEKYARSSDTDTLTVSRRSTTLSLSVQSSIKVGDIVNLVATLKKDDEAMSGEVIKFYVNSVEKGSPPPTDASGTTSISHSFSSPGQYVISANFSGTLKYAPSSDATKRTVAMTRTSLTLIDGKDLIVTKVGSSVALNATLKDEGGNPIKDKLIDYYVNSQYVNSDFTDTSGFSSIIYTPSEASPSGGWKVEARYDGDLTYSSSVDTATIVVNKLTITLTLSVTPTTPVTIEQSIKMTTTLKDENKDPIKDQSINFLIYVGTRWTSIGNRTTDEKGNASMDYSPTTSGTLRVQAKYSGSTRYPATSSDIIDITVNKIRTTLALSIPTTTKVEQTVMISATLKDENQKTIPTVTVEYYLLTGGLEQAIGLAKTNQNGVASLPYTSTSVGAFQIKATYSESTKYLASSDTKELTVSSLTTTLTLEVPTTARVGDTITLGATLTDEEEKALRGVSIEYSIYSGGAWNKIGTAVTNASGMAIRDYTPSEAGTFLLSAEFKGDPTHADTTSQEVTLIVNKVQTTLTISLSNITTTIGTSIKISATLNDEDSQPIPRSSVYYQIFNEEDWISGEWTGIGSATTNLQGVASLYFQPTEAGTFRFRAVYEGDPKYGESTSEETNLEVTGGNPPGSPFDLGFLGDNQLTILDLLFWGIIILVFATLTIVVIRRKIKSSEKQTSIIRRQIEPL